MLDFFQIRRCQEDLVPSVDHPGCIYGEMNRCMRPCQQAVSGGEYQSEVERVRTFLESGGGSLVHSITAARDCLSDELNFEDAARQQQRLTRPEQVLRLREDLAVEAVSLNGIAVLPSVSEGCVELRFLVGGGWRAPIDLSTMPTPGTMIPLDRRLRELALQLSDAKLPAKIRQEHLALLARWYFCPGAMVSGWRLNQWRRFHTGNWLTRWRARRSVRNPSGYTWGYAAKPVPKRRQSDCGLFIERTFLARIEIACELIEALGRAQNHAIRGGVMEKPIEGQADQ